MRSLSCLAALTLAAVTAAAPDAFDPLPRKDEILKRFVDEFVELKPGTDPHPKSFRMGSDAAPDQKPARDVTFAKPFSIAKNEVTQELYWVVMGGNPSKWKGPRNAVELTSWHDAVEFCKKATALLRDSKRIAANQTVRLPSEAEWEYACRAGTTTAWSFGDDVGDLTHYCWYNRNSKGFDPPVGQKKANPWGLFDMHGYNWEWVADDYVADYRNAPTDGSAVTSVGAEHKVIRGGAWSAPAEASRSAHRDHKPATFKDDTLGFRCVLD